MSLEVFIYIKISLTEWRGYFIRGIERRYQMRRIYREFILVALGLFLYSCPSPNYVPPEFQYSEYRCPEPIGVIVRENCRENVIKYQAEDVSASVKGSVTQIATAEGSYKNETRVLQEASEFMQFLKDQQVSLCNDYNTCKLTTQEYKERKDRINKTFTTIYALTKQIKVSDLDPEIKKDIMKKILAIIDEYNKPLSKPENPATKDPSEKVIKFKPAPAKARDFPEFSPTPQQNPPVVKDVQRVRTQGEGSGDDVTDAMDEAQKQMLHMQKKAIEIQKKAIEMQKGLENNADEGGEEY